MKSSLIRKRDPTFGQQQRKQSGSINTYLMLIILLFPRRHMSWTSFLAFQLILSNDKSVNRKPVIDLIIDWLNRRSHLLGSAIVATLVKVPV